MAKTESTAVNALIDLVQNKKPLASDAAPDLFSEPKSTRMTSTVPPMRGAGEVAPLPRGRAPQSTANHAMPNIRMGEASPSRGTTIPPLPPAQSAASTRASSPSKPSLPAPHRASTPAPVAPPAPHRASTPSPVAPPAPQRAATPSPVAPPAPRMRTAPSGTLPPASLPVAAPFEVQARASANPIASTPSATLPGPFGAPSASPSTTGRKRADSNPFAAAPLIAQIERPITPPEELVIDEPWIDTAQTRSRGDTIALVKKLIAPAIVLAIVGVMVGGFFAFDGQGGKKKKTSAAGAAPAALAAQPDETGTGKTEEMVVRPAAPSAESANAGTASAGGEQPEPPTKAEQAAEIAAAASMTQDAPKEAVEAIAAAPVAPAAAAAAAAPTIREVKTQTGVITFVDVRIDSTPAGATVTLVDRGKQSFLGTTPLATSVDASREYDVIVAIDGRPTQMVHLDPNKTSRVDVSLGRTVPRASRPQAELKTEVVAAAVETKSAKAETAKVATAETAKVETAKVEKAAKTEKPAKADKKAAKTQSLADVDFEMPKAEKPAKADKKSAKTDALADVVETPAKAEKPAKADKAESKSAIDDAIEKALASDSSAPGTLMVSSKPPCEIHIDGKATGLTTPQRSIELAPGTHKITFVNEAEGIKKTVTVKIKAGEPTKLIQDLMKK